MSKVLTLEDLNNALKSADTNQMEIVVKDLNGKLHNLDRNVFIQFQKNQIILFESNIIP